MLRQKKKYQGPGHPWQAVRIKEEAALVTRYGLKNKKEIWRAQSTLRNWRVQARKLVSIPEEKRKDAQKPLFDKLSKYGLLNEKSGIDDVLSLNIEQVLALRLQTAVHKLGLANTVNQARQFIVHKKVAVNDQVTTSPSYEVKTADKVALVKGFVVKATPKQVAEEEPKVEEVKEDGE